MLLWLIAVSERGACSVYLYMDFYLDVMHVLRLVSFRFLVYNNISLVYDDIQNQGPES